MSNPINLNPAEADIKLAQDIWNALAENLTTQQVEQIACLDPTCENRATIGKRKWRALITLAAVLYIRTEIGSDSVQDVLDDLDYCSC